MRWVMVSSRDALGARPLLLGIRSGDSDEIQSRRSAAGPAASEDRTDGGREPCRRADAEAWRASRPPQRSFDRDDERLLGPCDERGQRGGECGDESDDRERERVLRPEQRTRDRSMPVRDQVLDVFLDRERNRDEGRKAPPRADEAPCERPGRCRRRAERRGLSSEVPHAQPCRDAARRAIARSRRLAEPQYSCPAVRSSATSAWPGPTCARKTASCATNSASPASAQKASRFRTSCEIVGVLTSVHTMSGTPSYVLGLRPTRRGREDARRGASAAAAAAADRGQARIRCFPG